MDSKHRHDLQENDLADFLHHFGKWWGKYGNMFLTVVLLVTAAIAVRNFVNKRASTLHDQAVFDLANDTSPESYKTTAQTYTDPTIQALAYLRGGDLLLARATRLVSASAQSQPADDLKEAKKMYQAVLDSQEAPHLIKMNASLGLAAVAEDQNDWDGARSLYQTVAKAAASTDTLLADRAKARLAMLDRIKTPVKFPAGKAKNPGALGDFGIDQQIEPPNVPIDIQLAPPATQPGSPPATQPAHPQATRPAH